MNSKFLEAINCISRNNEVSYYIESKLKDSIQYLSMQDRGEILLHILNNENAGDFFRYLNKLKILQDIFPPLYNLKGVKQNKRKSSNAFEHTIKVIDCVPVEDIDLRWVALFHDLGKKDAYSYNGNFNYHNVYSRQIAEVYCDIFNLKNKDKITTIVYNHMLPQDYQINPVWKEPTIKRFIKNCDIRYVNETIWFAVYDKQAENKNPEYIQPYYKLLEKVNNIIIKENSNV